MRYLHFFLLLLPALANALVIKGVETGTTYADVTRFQAPGSYEPNEAALVDPDLLDGVLLREHGGRLQKNLVTHLGGGWFITAGHTRPYQGQRYFIGGKYFTPDIATIKTPPSLTWKGPHPSGFIQTLGGIPDICLFRMVEPVDGIRGYRVADSLANGDEFLVHGWVTYGGLNWATGPNQVRGIQGGKFSFADLSTFVTISGDSGGPSFVRTENDLEIIGIHQGQGQDVNLTDSQIRAWIYSVVNEPEPVERQPIEETKPDPEPHVKTITIKAGETIIIKSE